MHKYAGDSQDQEVHARYALELLRVYGNGEEVSSMLVAILSCFYGRSCLETLVYFDIHLDRFDCECLHRGVKTGARRFDLRNLL